MADEPYFSEELSDRQLKVVMHCFKVLGVTPDYLHYIKSEERIYDLFPVDVAVFEPAFEEFNYYVATTVGLSSYRFDNNFARSELLMVLPSTWKPNMDKEEYYWPLRMLQDIAYQLVENKVGVCPGQVFVLGGEDDKATYSKYTDAVGGIVTMPEMFPIEMFSEKIDETLTRYFQLVPVTNDDVKKIDEVGPKKFTEFELHDADGPTMVVKLKERQVEGIEKLVKQNEDSLKGVSDK